MPRSIFSCYSIHARLAIVTTFAARCSRRGPKRGRRRVSPNSFGEGTSSEEGSRRSTPSSICIRTQAKCARFDVNPVPEAAGGKGSKGPTQFPEIRRETGLSERSKVRNKLSPGNASTAFSSSRLRTDATFKLSSPAANFQRVQTSRSGVTSYRENDSVRRVARSESREDAGCRHSRDRMGGKLLEIRFSTRRVTLP